MAPQLSAAGARRRRRRTTAAAPANIPPSDIPRHPATSRDIPSYQIVIKSFRRFRCLDLLIRSILKFHPDASIIVADDSFEHPETELPPLARTIQSLPGVDWIQLPFNIGLPAGRNTAIRHATADVIVMCDDDFVFTPTTRLDNLLTILAEHAEIDIAGGAVRFHGEEASHWCGHLHFAPHQPMRVTPLETPWHTTGHIRHRATDLNLNWYAARRTALLKSPWDEQFKITFEHIDHFMQMKCDGICIHYTPDSTIGHEPRNPESYGQYRMQQTAEYARRFLSKWSITQRPGWQMQFDPDTDPWSPMTGRSVLVFGVGHSGTTILTQMLSALGFNAHHADEEFAEHTFIRDINQHTVASGTFNATMARRELAYMEQAGGPWVLKDPRFVHTLDRWMPLFQLYQPIMVFIERDHDSVAESFRRRGEALPSGEVITRGLTLQQAQEQAREHFERWPWAKVRIAYEQIHQAIGLFSPRPAQEST